MTHSVVFREDAQGRKSFLNVEKTIVEIDGSLNPDPFNAIFDFNKFASYIATKSDACSSGEAAQDPLCPLNSTTPRCIEPFTNPWIFNCRFE